MKKPLTLGVAIVFSAAGFAAASIVAGGSLAAVTRELTHGMWTTGTNLDTTSTTIGGRGVAICHRRGHHGYRTLVIDGRAVSAHLRKGDTIGYCTTGALGNFGGHRHGHGLGGGDDDSVTTTTTTSADTSTSSGFTTTSPGFGFGHHGKGLGGDDSQAEDAQGDDDSQGGGGAGTTTTTAAITVSGFTSTQSGGSDGGDQSGQHDGGGSGD